MKGVNTFKQDGKGVEIEGIHREKKMPGKMQLIYLWDVLIFVWVQPAVDAHSSVLSLHVLLIYLAKCLS